MEKVYNCHGGKWKSAGNQQGCWEHGELPGSLCSSIYSVKTVAGLLSAAPGHQIVGLKVIFCQMSTTKRHGQRSLEYDMTAN